MALRYKIDCINRRHHDDPNCVISHVGGPLTSGRYRETIENAIRNVEAGNWTFYVLRSGYEADVIVAVSSKGNKYLKTKADNTTLDNLASLNSCPIN